MRKLSQAEWIAVVAGILIVIGAFYYSRTVNMFTEDAGAVLSEVVSSEEDAALGQSTEFMTENIRKGNGAVAQTGDTLVVHYTGRLESGVVFDSSAGRAPFSFTLGAGEVIAGWDQGLVGMQVGGERRLTIPPELGYGSRAVGPIPPNSTLVFEVELIDIVE